MIKYRGRYQFIRSGTVNDSLYLLTAVFIFCFAVMPTVVTADSSTGIYFEVIPPNPSTVDDIRIKTYFQGGPFIVTHSHSVAGKLISVILFRDGVDFSPNPPFDFTEDIGKLPPGEYQVSVSVRWDPSSPEVIETLYGSFVVTQPVSVPTLNEYGTLILSLLLVGSSLYFLRRNNIRVA